MKWLYIVAIIFLAQQPAEPPKSKGTAESKVRSAASTEDAKNHQQTSAQSAPTPVHPPVMAECQRNTATASNQAQTNAQQTAAEDLAVQRKLAWFTGALVGVGALQALVMFLTWRVYARQAREMRRQRHEMRRQRHVMFGQYKAMRDQIAQMEGAGKQTAELIKQASTQSGLMALAGTHTEQLAQQAARQADLSQQQLELSQRPWVSVVRIPQALQFDPDGAKLGTVFKLENCGGSVAWNVSVWTDLVPTEEDWRLVLERLCGIPKDPKNANSDYGYVLFPGETTSQYQPAILRRDKLDKSIQNDTFKGTGKVGFMFVGCIDYRSYVSPNHYQTTFVDLVGYPDSARGGIVMGAFDPKQKLYSPVVLTPHGHGASAT